MKVIAIAVLFLCGISGASAQSATVYRYDSVVMDASIKCELGRVARTLARSRQSLDPTRMKVFVTVTGEETISKKVGGSIFSIGGSYERKTGRARGFEGERNIHVDNTANCRKSYVVDVGIYSCFEEQKGAFIAGQRITCTDTSTATANAKAGAKFAIWVLDAEVSGEFANTRTFKIDSVAPPRPNG